MTKKKPVEDKDYHGVAPISSIVKKMKKDYDKDKKGWKIVGSKDDQGNDDTFITKKPNTYWLKSKQVSPYSAMSLGSVVRNLDKDIDEEIGKKLSKEDMLRLFGMVVPIKQQQHVMAAGIQKYSEKHGNHLRNVIGEKNTNLGYQMARKLDEKFTKRHPQRKNLYI